MDREIYIAGVGMTPFGRHLDKAVWQLASDAVRLALADAGAEMSQIEQAYYGTGTQAALQGQFAVPGQVAFARFGLSGIPVYNVENACATGTSAFQMAVQALRAGACDIAIAVGAEKMNIEDRARALAMFEGGWDVSLSEENAARLLALGEGVTVPDGTESDRPYSRFMAIYAATCRFWMKTFGTTQRQIAAIAAKNHMHSVHNPLAQYRKPYTIDEVLTSAPITYPLTIAMCGPLTDGGAAVIVCTAKGLAELAGSRDRAIKVAATAIATASPRDATQFEQAVCRRAADIAYERAGLGPESVSVAEVHDATAMGEIVAAEYLRLTPMGEAGPAAECGELSIGGRIPINPSGGLECKGHPIGATGLAAQLRHELMELTEAGARQVSGAKVALQENGGGSIGYEEAVVTVNILTR
ncbi:thiolase family protein [Bradyrhizobium sp.]|uniref:thiolase family protein n=2 Tax=Bradyrhizobium sp. TaxID=376 RepID=UPI00391DFAB7